MGFFISLEKDADVIIGGVKPKKVFRYSFIILFFFIVPFCNYDTPVEVKKELHIH